MDRQWVLNSQEGFEKSLEYQTNVATPSPSELGPNEVLVKLHAASLNYRELVIAGLPGMNGPIEPPVIPGCDGAGVVEAIGSSVREFQLGDRVVTYLAPEVAEKEGDYALPGISDAAGALGQGTKGTLRSRGVFSEKALAQAPRNISHIEASTLPCTFLTAYNALFGVKGKEVGPGSWVLVQGTGGVSIATLQVAVAAGANVVATTSSEERASRLKALGATSVVNYRTSPDTWGKEARALTPHGRGFDLVMDIGGNETLLHSLDAIRVDGVVVLGGAVGGNAEAVPLFSAFFHTCIVRAIISGSRQQMRETCRFVEEKNIKPAIDDVVFELADAKDGYKRLLEKKHFSKVVIRIDH